MPNTFHTLVQYPGTIFSVGSINQFVTVSPANTEINNILWSWNKKTYENSLYYYAGWWFQPSWKIWVRQWEGWHPKYYGKIKAMFQTTNQYIIYLYNIQYVNINRQYTNECSKISPFFPSSVTPDVPIVVQESLTRRGRFGFCCTCFVHHRKARMWIQ